MASQPGMGQRVTGPDRNTSRREEDQLVHYQLRGSRFIKSGWTEALGSSTGFLMLGHSPRPFQDQQTRRGGTLRRVP